MSEIASTNYQLFLKDVKKRILSAQYEALRAINKELIALYGDIGSMIVERQEKEGWGQSVVERLSEDLQKEFPGIKGFSVQNLWYMRQFHRTYRGNEKLQPLVGEISWSKHIIIMSKCKDDLEREFYIKMTKKFGWTKNVLIHQIESRAYERFLLNQTNFDQTLPEKYRPQVKLAVKDEYTFDFLELGAEHSERELELALILKVGKFKPEYAGKMQFYLSVLNDTIKLAEENPSIGIILCKEKNRIIVEYALKDTTLPIGVSTHRITPTLPEELQKYLPSGEEIAKRLEGVEL